MAKTQNKEILLLVAEQLRVELGPCAEHYSDMHECDIKGRDETLVVSLDEGTVKIEGRAYGETRKQYNIKLTLEEVDLDPTV